MTVPNCTETASAIRAASSGSGLATETSRSTVSGALVTDTVRASCRIVPSRSSSSITGWSTSGLFASGAYDFTRCTANCEP